MVSISGMAEHHQNCACAALLHEDSDALAEHLSKAVHLRALLARFYAAIPVLDTGVIALSYNASTALDLAAPTMLGDWPQGETCAKVLLSAGESEMARDPDHRRTHSWGRGTVAAFIIEFLASEYRLSHRYSPQVPLASEYVKLLSAFRETDKNVYEGAMRAAIARHVRESKETSRFKPPSDFHNDFHRFFPVELLSIQAIRRRDGLPEFDTKHPLVDMPWSLLRTATCFSRMEIAGRVEMRLRLQYSRFV